MPILIVDVARHVIGQRNLTAVLPISRHDRKFRKRALSHKILWSGSGVIHDLPMRPRFPCNHRKLMSECQTAKTRALEIRAWNQTIRWIPDGFATLCSSFSSNLT